MNEWAQYRSDEKLGVDWEGGYHELETQCRQQ